MFGLFDLVLRMFDIETEDRNAILIHYAVGIDLAIIIYPGYGLSSSGHAYTGAIKITDVFFEGFATSSRLFILTFDQHLVLGVLDAPAESVQRHSHASAIFDMVASWGIEFFVFQPPGGIHMQSSHTFLIESFAIEYQIEYAAHHRHAHAIQLFTHTT